MGTIGDTLETVGLCLEYYREKVKPFLDDENLAKAKTGMTNLIISGLYPNFPDIFPFRSAPNCFHTADEILAQMRGKETLDRKLFDEFEAYLAQTRLSLSVAQSNN